MDADKLKASAGWNSGLRNRSCHIGFLVGELIQLRSQGQAGVDRPDITEHTWDSEGPRDPMSAVTRPNGYAFSSPGGKGDTWRTCPGMAHQTVLVLTGLRVTMIGQGVTL